MRNNHNSVSNVSLTRRSKADAPNTLPPFGSTAAGLFSDFQPFLSSPFAMMERMQRDMDRLFADVIGLPSPANSWERLSRIPTTNVLAPTVDVSETDRDYRIEIDLPGVSQEAVDVRILEGTLVVRAEIQQDNAGNSGDQSNEQPSLPDAQNAARQYHYRERRWGSFERMFHLPVDSDEDNVHADFSSGVLTLTVPKKANQVDGRQGRRIAIGSTDDSSLLSGKETGTASAAPSAS